MFVRALMAIGPRCFRCRYVMSSGPAVEVDLVSCIAVLVMFGVEGRGRVGVG